MSDVTGTSAEIAGAKVRVYAKAQNRAALGIMHAYMVINPKATLADLQSAFPDSLNPDSGVKKNFVYAHEKGTDADWDGFFRKEDELLTTGDGKKVSVVTMWTKPSFERLVQHAKQYGIIIADFEADGPVGEKGRFRLEYLNGFTPAAVAKKEEDPTDDTVSAAQEEEEEKEEKKKDLLGACIHLGVNIAAAVASPVAAFGILATEGGEILEDVQIIGGAAVKGAKYVADKVDVQELKEKAADLKEGASEGARRLAQGIGSASDAAVAGAKKLSAEAREKVEDTADVLGDKAKELDDAARETAQKVGKLFASGFSKLKRKAEREREKSLIKKDKE